MRVTLAASRIVILMEKCVLMTMETRDMIAVAWKGIVAISELMTVAGFEKVS
jgi:hypothetical protein